MGKRNEFDELLIEALNKSEQCNTDPERDYIPEISERAKKMLENRIGQVIKKYQRRDS